MSEIRKFFVVGTARSGTTLLQAMLMSSPGVYIPPETQYMGMLWQYRERYGDLRIDENWRLAINRVNHMMEHREMKLDNERLDKAFADCPRTHAGLFGAWLDEIAFAAGVGCIGEKSPAHTQYVTELLAMFPDASVVHIVRDPRDVTTSQLEIWRRNALHVALGWRRDSAQAAELSQLLNPDRYSVVRYEDLVVDPESVLRPICEQLGLEFDQRMLSPHTRERTGLSKGMEHLKRTLEPVTAKRIGRWTESLSRFDVAVVERVCGRYMARFGYEKSNTNGLFGVAGIAYQAPLGLLGRMRLRRRRADIERKARGVPH